MFFPAKMRDTETLKSLFPAEVCFEKNNLLRVKSSQVLPKNMSFLIYVFLHKQEEIFLTLKARNMGFSHHGLHYLFKIEKYDKLDHLNFTKAAYFCSKRRKN